MPERAVTLSIIVPAYNEQENLRPACETIARLAPQYLADYELILVDDASRDGTWSVAGALQKENSHVRAFRNPRNMGLGYNYYFGVEQARCQYAMLVPGDNEASEKSLAAIFAKAGSADILVTYIVNPYARPIARQATSRLFTLTMNMLFGLRLPYFNGINVIRTDLVRTTQRVTDGFAYMAMILVQLLKAGHTYTTEGFLVQKRAFGTTKAFRIKNILSVLRSVAWMWKRMYLSK